MPTARSWSKITCCLLFATACSSEGTEWEPATYADVNNDRFLRVKNIRTAGEELDDANQRYSVGTSTGGLIHFGGQCYNGDEGRFSIERDGVLMIERPLGDPEDTKGCRLLHRAFRTGAAVTVNRDASGLHLRVRNGDIEVELVEEFSD